MAIGLSLCVAVAAVATVTVRSGPGAGPIRVVIFGDSLTYQAEPYFNLLVDAGGRASVGDFAFGGTAVCDWLSKMRTVTRSEHPQVAVIEFVGNTFTSCMHGCIPESQAAVIQYCSDMTTAIGVFLAVGTHVYLVGTPIDHAQWVAHDRHWDVLDLSFSALAKKYPDQVTYVDAGAAVEGPGQSFVWTLPCLTFESCTGPTVAGVRTDVVRSPDGVHFCPGQSGNAVGQVSGCHGYSSGAFRFAAAMAGPVISRFHLESRRPAPGLRRT